MHLITLFIFILTKYCTLNMNKKCTYVVNKGKSMSTEMDPDTLTLIVGNSIDPSTLTLTSGKVSCSSKHSTFPLASTLIGYLRRCPCNGVKSWSCTSSSFLQQSCSHSQCNPKFQAPWSNHLKSPNVMPTVTFYIRISAYVLIKVVNLHNMQFCTLACVCTNM